MKWFQNSFRRNMIDMHISDQDERFLSEFSAEKYADCLAAAGVDTAIIYAGSCLGINYFETDKGYRHKNVADRDIFGETVQACRKKGLNIVMYFNIWSRYAYDTHPEWRMRSMDGRGYNVDFGERFGLCCPNTGYFDYVKDMITELVSKYPADGLWIDMIGWFGHVCYCDSCRKRFQEETGLELPEIIDWGDERFLTFVKKREEWFVRMAEMITKTGKSIQPDITVTQQCASWTLGWTGATSKAFFEQSDYLAGDFYEGGTEQSVICKYLSNITLNRPIEFMVSRCCDLTEHTMNKTEAELTAQRYSALANQASFVFIDAIDPVGTIDKRTYIKMGNIFEQSKQFEEHLSADYQLLADVGLVITKSALINIEENGKNVEAASTAMPHLKAIYNLAEALIDRNILFDVINLDDEQTLNRFKVLVLSDLALMEEHEVDNVRKFVKNGGIVYASGRTSLYPPQKDRDFALSDVFGVSFIKMDEDAVNYIAPKKENEPLFAGFSEKYPLSVKGAMTDIKAHTAKVLATCMKPYYPAFDINHFSSAISEPPGIQTGTAAVTENHYGNGKVFYTAGAFETNRFDAVREVFGNVISSMIDTPLVITDAPRAVEVLVHQKENEYKVGFLNFQKKLPPVSVHEITVKVYLGNQRPISVYDVGRQENISYSVTDGYVKFAVHDLKYYDCVIIRV